MTDLSEIGMNKDDITNSDEISSRRGHIVDSTEISDKDVRTMNSHVQRTKLTGEEDQALPRWGPSSVNCSWLPLRGSQDESQENSRWLGGRGAVSLTPAYGS